MDLKRSVPRSSSKFFKGWHRRSDVEGSLPHQDGYHYFQLYDPDEQDSDSCSDENDNNQQAQEALGSAESGQHHQELCWWHQSKKKTQAAIIGTTLVACVSMAIYFNTGMRGQPTAYENSRVILSSATELRHDTHAAVATDGEPCAQIGVDVLRRNGTAVDAAIATLFCNGVYSSQSMGIGGGFLMTIYSKENRFVETLDAREEAPAASFRDMFSGNEMKSTTGPLSVAVPGEIRGYYEAKLKYGNPNVSWSSLIQPTINMSRNGIRVSWHAARAMRRQRESLFADPHLRQTFVNPSTNDTWKEGDIYKREILAKTLETIANKGADEFYYGEVGKNFISDLEKLGGIMTADDLANYRVKWAPSVTSRLNNNITVHSVPLPGSGLLLTFILNVLKHFNIGPHDDNPLLYHRITEVFKWAYAYRSHLGDPSDLSVAESVNKAISDLTSSEKAFEIFQKIDDTRTYSDPSYYGADFNAVDDHGTSHTCVLAPNGDAVSVTSTINLRYGANIMSATTGIIYNDEMDDFSSPDIVNEFGLPPSPNNFIQPGKRPLSSMVPTIVIDEESGSVRLITGAAGGTKITTATALVIIRTLLLQQNIKEAIDARRIHHQLLPMEIEYEEGISKNIVDGLEAKGHLLKQVPPYTSVATGIAVMSRENVWSNADFRKSGGTAGF